MSQTSLEYWCKLQWSAQTSLGDWYKLQWSAQTSLGDGCKLQWVRKEASETGANSSGVHKDASETGAKSNGVRKEASETGANSSGVRKKASETGANSSGVRKQASETGANSSRVRKEASKRLNLNNTVQAKRSAVTDNQHTACVSERRDLAYVPIADNPNSQVLCPQGKAYNIMYRDVPRKLSHQTAPDKMSVGRKPYEIFNKYLPSSTGVEGGKNLV